MANTQNLDGKTPIVVTPYDAHEQIVRAPHTHSAEAGYQPLTEVPFADTEVQEFPKAVDHVQKPDAPEGHKEPVVARDAEEEAAYNAGRASVLDEQAKPSDAEPDEAVPLAPRKAAKTPTK